MFERDPLANPEPLIRRVYAYVAYRIGDGPDAEDVTSATFELIALRYGDDLTARQIADLLDLRTNAVEVALHRALARLRVFLGERESQVSEPRATDVQFEV